MPLKPAWISNITPKRCSKASLFSGWIRACSPPTWTMTSRLRLKPGSVERIGTGIVRPFAPAPGKRWTRTAR